MKPSTDKDRLELDGRRQITLDNARTLYLVEKGTVFLHFAEIDVRGINRRKHFIEAYKPGQIFSGCMKGHGGKKYALVASGEKDTEVRESRFDEPQAGKVNDFFRRIIGETAEIQALENIDGEIVERNNGLAMDYLIERIRQKEIQELEDIRVRKQRNDSYAAKSRHYVLGIFRKSAVEIVSSGTGDDDLLYGACRLMCRHMKVDIAPFEEIKKCVEKNPGIEDIARISKFASRDVLLEENWWKADNGPLLVLAMEDERPLVCIPVSPGRYKLVDVKNSSEAILTPELANGIIPRGYMFYRPFPNRTLGYRDLFLFGVEASWKRDIAKLLLATLVSSLIGLLLPELNQRIFDDYIPEGDKAQLIQMGMLLLSFMVGNSLVALTKSFCTFRASNMMEYAIQAATLDRLFNLPGKFFAKYTSGDLASRAMGITTIFNTLAEVAISTFLSSIFSLLYLWRMFHYSKQLSWLGLVMVAVSVGTTLAVGFLQMKYQKQILEISNKLAGFMYQLLLGIAKIRVSGSEDRAIYKWNVDFLKTRKLAVEMGRMSTAVGTLNNMLTTLFSVLIYYTLIAKKVEVSLGAFMAYSSAFGSFSGAMMDMAQSFMKVNNLVPVFEKAKPVLDAKTEFEGNMEFVGALSGAIEVSNVNFRYAKDGPSVLKNVNISIKAGEYIGIVGPSGGGKSTLLKILLGFEKIDTGKVFYDDKDLDLVDKRELRKKLGVVLQEGHLISGSIYENITITNSRIPMKSVREVIHETGLDEVIEKMPMGLYTNLMEDGGTISGGQKQRILIARAIVNKPKIIFFDEATSALDNVTQAVVCESLDRLKATRVVIAHRLSTIVKCDRILVIDNGEIVEQGSYADLMENKGLFHELAARQLN